MPAYMDYICHDTANQTYFWHRATPSLEPSSKLEHNYCHYEVDRVQAANGSGYPHADVHKIDR